MRPQPVIQRGPCPVSIARVAALLAVGGCTVGPTYTRPASLVPETWSVQSEPHIAAQPTADARWWSTFNDPALDRLIDLAWKQNLPLQIAGLRILEARAQLGIATARQFPQFQVLTGAVSAQRINAGLANVSNLGRQFFVYELSVDAAWELDLWGKYRRGVEASANQLRSSVADHEGAVVSLTAEVARTYVVVRTYEVLVDQAQENARIQEEGLRIAEARFTNGATSELDVTQATTLLESTRASIPQLQAQLEQARNALSTLLGQPPGTLDALLAGPRAIPQPPDQVAVGVPAEILRRRPDIRSAELQAASQAALVGIAKTEFLPSLTISGTAGIQDFSSSPASHNPFNGDNFVYTVGPRLVWSFFDYGRRGSAVQVEDARFQQLLVGYRNRVLQAVKEVEDAMTSFINAQRAMESAQRATESAQRSVQLAVVQYREGAVDYTRVLDAERSLLEQQNNLAQTESSAATSLIFLYKALGGGWELQKGQPVVPPQVQNEMELRTDWGDLVTKPRWPETEQKGAPGEP